MAVSPGRAAADRSWSRTVRQFGPSPVRKCRTLRRPDPARSIRRRTHSTPEPRWPTGAPPRRRGSSASSAWPLKIVDASELEDARQLVERSHRFSRERRIGEVAREQPVAVVPANPGLERVVKSWAEEYVCPDGRDLFAGQPDPLP